ncbi:uncharacterized protein LOC126370917 [Pectinophora gossypiella]|uniref:uncharacterized protein LOC126370917 n=1 Tax=Pectinophora gossypiella TaxID=13191 RepID=UPI00214F0B7A|nr:uncharacterized protein LOC126370917 [Pectinophora gossypiella]
MDKADKKVITHAGSQETGESGLRSPIVCGGDCDRFVGSPSSREQGLDRVDFYPAFNATTGLDTRASTPSALPEARVVLERLTPDVTPAQSADGAVPGPKAQRRTRRIGPSLVSSSDETSSLRTVCSMESITSLPEGTLWRKRKTVVLSDPSSDEGDRAPVTELGSPVMRARAKRGRGRPPTTGEYVGLAKAKAELNRARREELMLEAEMAVAESARKIFGLRSSGTPLETGTEAAGLDPASATGTETVADLYQKAKDAAAVIESVASKSGRLKGTFVRALKDSTRLIVQVLDVLRSTSESEETRNLQAQNSRLQKALDEQRREIESLRLEMRQVRDSLGASQSTRPPAPAPASPMETSLVSESPLPEPAPKAASAKPAKKTDPPLRKSSRATSDTDGDLAAQIISQVGFMIDAKLAGLEDRLLPPKTLPPPLAADRKNAKSYAAAARTPAVSARTPATAATKKATATAAGTTRATPLAASQGPAAAASGPTSAPPKKKKKRGPRGRKKGKKGGNGGQGEAQPLPSGSAGDGWTTVGQGRKKKAAPTQQRSKVPKMRTPRTAAVVLHLQPAAADGGTTYADVLRTAKAKVNLQSLGITNLRIRKAVTGARVLELAGATSAEKADTLAEKLRESMSGDVVKVSRPIKRADMRIVGLDDSVTAQEVVEAVATAGGCATDAIRTGVIRVGAGGMGSLMVSCPVAAAKRVAKGRLLVGWTSVQVRVLEPRPLRCFRCHETGHAHAMCESESSQCSATPHCTVCEAARRPAEHRLGSSKCTAQTRNKRKVRDGPQASSRPSRPQAAGRVGAEPMHTN